MPVHLNPGIDTQGHRLAIVHPADQGQKSNRGFHRHGGMGDRHGIEKGQQPWQAVEHADEHQGEAKTHYSYALLEQLAGPFGKQPLLQQPPEAVADVKAEVEHLAHVLDPDHSCQHQ